MGFFPFYADIEGKHCLVIGGGIVALRKIEKVLPFKPRVSVVAPEMCDEIRGLDVSHVLRKFRDSDLADADFVICATDDEKVNERVYELCRAGKIPVNTVDDKEKCSFIFPAIARGEGVIAAVTTEGKSPLYARYIREKIEELLASQKDSELIVSILGEYRNKVKESVDTEERRKRVFSRILALCLEEGAASVNDETVERIIREEIDEDQNRNA